MSWHPDQSRAFLGYHVRDPDQHCPGSLPVPTVRMFCTTWHSHSLPIPIHYPLAHLMSDCIRTRFSITPWYGKQFPGDCLQYPDLEFYCDRLRAIPPDCPVKYDLSVHLNVQNFISSTFPSHTRSLVVEAASECFSDSPPNEILATLVDRDIPSQKFIQDMRLKFGQAVLDRRRSIKDPLNDRSFLPFWVLTLWERLTELNTARKDWLSANEWFQRFSPALDPTAFATTKKHLTRIGWGAEITVGRGRATALTLPQLFADARLNSTVLDLMAECTQMEVDYNGPTHVCICGTVFANKVAQLNERNEGPPDWFQERFIDPVKSNQWQTLYFPMFWPKHKHWVSVKVDFTTRRISIGQ